VTAVTPDVSSIGELRAAVAGRVYLAGDEGYDAAWAPFNLRHAHTPSVIVEVSSAADVASALRWAGVAGLPVAVQSTGHGNVGAYTGCLLINTSRLDSVEIDVDGRTATLGAGVRWRQVMDAGAKHGLAPLNGSSSGVGVVGYTTGGGLPLMGRTFGFSADNVRGFDLVTADGVVHVCSPDSEPDLFWAVRGGKGNFGVVTSLTVNLVPVATVYGGMIVYDGPAAPEVFRAYRAWVDTLPESTTTSLALMRLPDLPFVPPPLAGKLTVHLRVVHVGSEEEGAKLLEPMRALGVPVIIDAIGEMPYTDADEIYHDPVDPLPVWESGVLLRELPAAGIEKILEIAGPGVDFPIVMVEIRHLGGALGRRPEHANAVAGRDGAFSFWVLGPMFPGLDAIVPGIGYGLLAGMQEWATKGSLLNFLGDRTKKEHVAACWTPEVYARLCSIKKAVDPDNMFRFGHALDPVVVVPDQVTPTD
jgi:FAD/FMN-containing dehydrogenase